MEEENKNLNVEEPTEVLGNTGVVEPVVETPAEPVAETPAEPVVEAAPVETAPVAKTPVEQPVEQPTVEPVAPAPTPEEPKKEEKKGSNKLLIIIALLVLVLGGGYAVWAFVLGGNTPKTEPKKEEQKEEKKDEDPTTKPDNKDLTVEDIPDRITHFIKAALADQSHGNIANKFLAETTNVEQIDKYALAIYASDKTIITNENIPNKYNEEQRNYLVNATPNAYMVSFEEFGKKYKEISNEEFDVNYLKTHDNNSDEGLGTCPALYDVNEEDKVLILSSQCGGTRSKTLYRKNYDYNIENGNHVIYQYAGYHVNEYEPVKKEYFITLKGEKVEVDKFEGNEKEFSTIIWKFDKDFNFISTEIVEK